MRRMVLPVVGLLAALLAVAAAAACGGDADEAAGTPSPVPASSTPGPNGGGSADPVVEAIRDLAFPAGLANGRSLGAETAPVVIQVFEDFQCPFCLRFTATFEHFLVEEFVEPGEVRLEFLNFTILGPESLGAAVAAHCAGEQDRFWEYQRGLFLIQAEAGQHIDEKVNVGRFDAEALEGLAGEVGLDLPAWQDCVDGDEALTLIQDEARQAREAGIRGTPGFRVNGAVLPGVPGSEESWRSVIAAAPGR